MPHDFWGWPWGYGQSHDVLWNQQKRKLRPYPQAPAVHSPSRIRGAEGRQPWLEVCQLSRVESTRWSYSSECPADIFGSAKGLRAKPRCVLKSTDAKITVPSPRPVKCPLVDCGQHEDWQHQLASVSDWHEAVPRSDTGAASPETGGFLIYWPAAAYVPVRVAKNML